MSAILLAWAPFLIGLFIATRKIQRKRAALPVLFGAYFLTFFISVIIAAIPIFSQIFVTGEGDPQLMAGSISVNIATGILRSIIDLPILTLIFFGIRKWRKRQS